jgi:hypothetical protein
MLINLQDFHNRDREANDEEASMLPQNCPEVRGPAKYEDIFSVDVLMNVRQVEEKNNLYAANLDRWTLRMN